MKMKLVKSTVTLTNYTTLVTREQLEEILREQLQQELAGFYVASHQLKFDWKHDGDVLLKFTHESFEEPNHGL